MDQEDDLLESLLAVATEELQKIENNELSNINDQSKNNTSKPHNEVPKDELVKEIDLFKLETNIKSKPLSNNGGSVVHSGDTDSSDDEGNKNYENQKYNEYGRSIKNLLASSSTDNLNSISSSHYGVPKIRISTWTPNSDNTKVNTIPKATNLNKTTSSKSYEDIFLDPIFGMRIVNPLISSTLLKERMQGRVAVKFSDLVRFIVSDSLKDKDWVICGVLVNKSPPKTSQKGTQFSIWTISDLKDDIKTVSLFMFSGAHTDLWKTVIGTVVGVLNPNIMEKKDGSKDVATLSVDTAQKLMIFGQSKDFGLCKSLKKNGEKCTSIVNLSRCEFCLYHIKQEYQKCSKRSELQANFVGKGLVNLRNKVLGKNEVFYAGKSYVAIPAKKSRKLEARDDKILQNLKGFNSNTSKPNVKKKGAARQLDINPAERARDLELLRKLGGPTQLESKTKFSGSRSNAVTLEDSKANALSVINKLKAKYDNSSSNQKQTCAKYDLKSDLYINVENKKGFSGKMSNNISLDESKQNTKIISKLKDKTKGSQLLDHKNLIEPLESAFDLKYSDEENDVSVEKLCTTKDGDKNSDQVTLSTSNTPNISQNDKTITSQNRNLSNGFQQKLLNKQVKNTQILEPMLPMTGNDGNVFKSVSLRQTSSMSLKSNDIALNMGIPKLSSFGKADFVDLSKPVTTRQVDRAKLNALKFIQQNGPIKKIDPNNTKNSSIKKRPIDNSEQAGNPSKKSKLQESDIISDRFKKMMAMTSKHSELVEQHDDEEREKYFQKQEMKERIEEKMVNTYKMKCKAVKCLKCKYTSFSASDLCKAEQHPLKVCKKFNEIGGKLLSRGFIQLEKRHANVFKRVKSALPRRESERKTHPLARHSDILQGVETRLSMLNMTYMRYIESKLICFIPGKVLDEIKSILDFLENNSTPPRTHQLLQELRDLSSMAMEHFDEHILPRCKEQLEQQTDLLYRDVSTSKSTRLLFHQQFPHAISNELYKVKKVTKSHKHHIGYLTQNTQKLSLKLRKQKNLLRIQSNKMQEQERKIQEQNMKIMEQETALNEIKKHIDDWDQKYKDLSTELVRARDEILLKPATNNSPSLLSTGINTQQNSSFKSNSPTFKSNIKPRVTHILPKNYALEYERKRKSSVGAEVPIKRSRSPCATDHHQGFSKCLNDKSVQNIKFNIPSLSNFDKRDDVNEAGPSKIIKNDGETSKSNLASTSDVIISFIDNILTNPLLSVKARKRKMPEDIDLK